LNQLRRIVPALKATSSCGDGPSTTKILDESIGYLLEMQRNRDALLNRLMLQSPEFDLFMQSADRQCDNIQHMCSEMGSKIKEIQLMLTEMGELTPPRNVAFGLSNDQEGEQGLSRGVVSRNSPSQPDVLKEHEDTKK